MNIKNRSFNLIIFKLKFLRYMYIMIFWLCIYNDINNRRERSSHERATVCESCLDSDIIRIYGENIFPSVIWGFSEILTSVLCFLKTIRKKLFSIKFSSNTSLSAYITVISEFNTKIYWWGTHIRTDTRHIYLKKGDLNFYF